MVFIKCIFAGLIDNMTEKLMSTIKAARIKSLLVMMQGSGGNHLKLTPQSPWLSVYIREVSIIWVSKGWSIANETWPMYI